MSVNVTGPKVATQRAYAAPSPLFLRDEELTRGVELLEAAHAALLGRPDRVLDGLGLSRNHGRILHCIGTQPGITMVELLGRTQLTKQTVSRLLKELVGRGLVARAADRRDRRRRLLELTAAGRELDEQLNGRLRRELASAYRAAGGEAVAGYHRVLLGLIDDHGRRQKRRMR